MRTAQKRREKELWLLFDEGVPLRTFGKCGHWKSGVLHIYTGSGRWFNQETGERGRLKSLSMREVLEIKHAGSFARVSNRAEEAVQANAQAWKKKVVDLAATQPQHHG